MRDEIWNSLVDAQFKGYCLSTLLYDFQKRNKILDIILAIASSGSIAAWTIWQNVPMVWGAIIAISQVITAIKPFFPYNKYIKVVNRKSYECDLLNLDFERLWYETEHQEISDKEAKDRYFKLREKVIEISNFEDDMAFKISTKIEEQANKKTKDFLQNRYNITINI